MRLGPWNSFPGIASLFVMHLYVTAIQNIFCVASLLHGIVQNIIYHVSFG